MARDLASALPRLPEAAFVCLYPVKCSMAPLLSGSHHHVLQTLLLENAGRSWIDSVHNVQCADILKFAGQKALSGGLPGMVAMGLQVLTLMWLR